MEKHTDTTTVNTQCKNNCTQKIGQILLYSTDKIEELFGSPKKLSVKGVFHYKEHFVQCKGSMDVLYGTLEKKVQWGSI